MSQEEALREMGARSYSLARTATRTPQTQATPGLVADAAGLGDRASTSGRALPDVPGSTAVRAKTALATLQAARQAVDDGRYDDALGLYSLLASDFPDLALAEYGRVGRAMLLYQAGQTSDAILALEDEVFKMVGSAELHAALAALLYTERPGLGFRAEEEWEVANNFDTRYSDLEFVRHAKHWPDRMVAALDNFLKLR
ncbi:hypothetical protein FOA52_009065 [Chlamydomonas sp. UWO 241]|nr:hypothetical protein FOA52_009065 [Chlamydomonas sp. UWO 241]